jgi:lipoprotein-anchoring transpeptidase ErfK/SrfK
MMASWKSALGQSWKSASWKVAKSTSLKFAVLGAGLLVGGCIQTVGTLEPASNSAMTARDKDYLAHAPYAQAQIPEQFQRHIVSFHRKEAPGTIIIDPDNKLLYLVQGNGKAIRYGVTVGEEAQGWSGVAKIGAMTEWPSWTPTAGEHQRLGQLPDHLAGGPANPMGARAMYLYIDGKDTLYRIHGTNQPEYIGQAISSGCIRMTNENAIDLYSRVKIGTTVVVLKQGQGDAFSAKLAFSGPGQQQ